MNITKEELCEIFGLPPDSSDDQIKSALKAGAQAISQIADERGKAEAAEAKATDATKKAEDAEAKCRGLQCDAFIAAHKNQITDEGKFREAYMKAPEATEAAVALCRTAEPPKAPAARISARDAKTPTTTAGTDAAMQAKIAARNNAVNAYLAAHPGCSHTTAWTACRMADPETFAD